LYDEIVKCGKEVNEFVDKAVTEALEKLEKEEKRR
jgi:hypothetical protein